MKNTITCKECKKTVVRTGTNQKYCFMCRNKRFVEYYEMYRQKPEYKEYQRKYHQETKKCLSSLGVKK
jgi:hypothetical protein